MLLHIRLIVASCKFTLKKKELQYKSLCNSCKSKIFLQHKSAYTYKQHNMGRSTENSNKRSNSASPDKVNKTPKPHDDGCSLSITRLIEQKFIQLSETFGNKLTNVSKNINDSKTEILADIIGQSAKRRSEAAEAVTGH